MKNQNKIVLLIISALYLAVHFVPDFGGADVMGAQWLYTSAVDAFVLMYLFLYRAQYSEAIKAVFSQKFSILYTFYFVWAIISVAYAINPTEAIVCLARLASTFFIFTNFTILLYKKDIQSYYLPVSILISLVLFYDSIAVISSFTKNAKTMLLDQNILSLMGKNGNKNVMAASLLIKFPFALFVILRAKFLGRLIGLFVLFFGSFALFILNTRSTFVGLFLILVIFAASTIYFKVKSAWPKIVWPLAYFIIPIAIAFFSANLVLDNAVKSQEVQGGYGTVTKRIDDITANTKEESRLRLWKAGLDYVSKHPFIGDGYGNWKLASIPYEKEYTNDLFVPYHAHNDFIEAAADLGIIGGLAYLGLFILAFLFTLRIWLKEDAKEFRLFATISFMALTCYFVDAFLNFPTERTSMQTMLTLTAGLLFAPAYFLTPALDKKNSPLKNMSLVYILLGLGLIGGSIYINNQVFKSLKVQKFVMGEIDTDPKMSLEEVENTFPAFPNLSTSTLPIKALIARYQFRDKNYDAALKLLRDSDRDNPFLHYNDFIRTAIFADKRQLDSVVYFAYQAFYHWPRSSSYYKNAIFAASKKRDTLEITKIFQTYNRYRTGGLAYSQYVLGLYEVKGSADKRMFNLLDAAMQKFPQDSAVILNAKNTLAGATANVANINNNAANGAKAFQKGRYAAAANFYLQASIAEPENYTHFENIGICYYSNKNYRNCIQYFDKANTFAQNTFGKSYFFKAMALIALGKKELACSALSEAKKRAYLEADSFIKANCSNN
jgi:O-antigen ligase